MLVSILNFIIFLSFAVFSFGQLGRVSFVNQEVNIYLYELCMLVVVIVLLIKYRLEPFAAFIKKARIALLTILFFAVSYGFSLYQYSAYQNMVAGLYFLRILFYLAYFILLSWYIRKNTHTDTFLSRGFLFFLISVLITSVFQYIWYPDLRNLDYLGWDSHYHRLFGVFLDTSIAAGVYGIIFFYLISTRKKLFNDLILKALIVLLPILGVILTFSRSAYIAFILTLSMYLLRKKKRIFIALCIAAFITFIYIVPKQFGNGVGLTRTFSVSARLKDYRNGLMIWSKFPLFGIGYNHLRYARERYSVIESAVDQTTASHAGASLSSSYVIILVCGGLIGFILFAMSLQKAVVVNPYLIQIFLYIGILSLADNVLLHPFIIYLMGSLYVGSLSRLSGKKR